MGICTHNTKQWKVLPRATEPFTELVKESGMRETTECTVPKSCILLKLSLLLTFPLGALTVLHKYVGAFIKCQVLEPGYCRRIPALSLSKSCFAPCTCGEKHSVPLAVLKNQTKLERTQCVFGEKNKNLLAFRPIS